MIPGLSPIVALALASGGEVAEATVLDSVEYHVSSPSVTLTKSWTIPADTDFLVAIVGGYHTISSMGSIGVTWNGGAMTLAHEEADSVGFGDTAYCGVFYKAAPATGARTAIVTFGAVSKAALVLIALKGIKQTSPVNNSNDDIGDGKNKSVSFTTTARSMRIMGRFEQITATFTTSGTELEDTTGDMGSGNGAIQAAYHLEESAGAYDFTSAASNTDNVGVMVVAAFEVA